MHLRLVLSFIFLALVLFTLPSKAEFFANFKPVEKDISVAYLQMILGETGGPENLDAAVKGKVSFLGSMVSVFNTGIIFLAFVLLIYQIIVTTYDMARSGQFLGEKGSFWLPLRSAFGLALLFPNGTSYCLAQAIVLYIVYGGIGLADSLWNEVAIYLQASDDGYIAKTLNSDDITSYAGTYLLEGTACLASWQKYLIDNNSPSSVANLRAQAIELDGGNKSLYFGYLPTGATNLTHQTSCYYSDNPLPADFADALALASNALRPDIIDYLDKEDANKFAKNYQTHAQNVADTLNGGYCQVPLDQIVDDSKYLKYGWLTAGMFFRKLLAVGKDGAADSPCANLPVITGQANMDSQVQDIYDSVIENLKDAIDKLQNTQQEETVDDSFDAVGALNKFKGEVNSKYTDVAGGRGARMYAGFIANNNGEDAFVIEKDGERITLKDPFKKAVDQGFLIMVFSLVFAVVITSAIIALNQAFQGSSGTSPLAWAMSRFTDFTWIFLTIFFGFFYMIGSLLTIYLPLIPMLMFLVAALGWFIFVFLAIMGAPIVALGILWPDKNEGFMGKATPSILMYLNLLLRPGLMIIGLLAGTLVCSIGFFLIISGFYLAHQHNIINPDGSVFAELPIGLALIYVLVAVAQKSFTLISEIPDRVLLWIGGQVAAWSFARDSESILQKGRSGFDQGAKMVGSNLGGIKDIKEITEQSISAHGKRTEEVTEDDVYRKDSPYSPDDIGKRKYGKDGIHNEISQPLSDAADKAWEGIKDVGKFIATEVGDATDSFKEWKQEKFGKKEDKDQDVSVEPVSDFTEPVPARTDPASLKEEQQGIELQDMSIQRQQNVGGDQNVDITTPRSSLEEGVPELPQIPEGLEKEIRELTKDITEGIADAPGNSAGTGKALDLEKIIEYRDRIIQIIEKSPPEKQIELKEIHENLKGIEKIETAQDKTKLIQDAIEELNNKLMSK